MKRLLLIAGLCFCLTAGRAQGLQSDEVSTDGQAPDSSELVTDLVGVVKENTKVILNWRLRAGVALPEFLTVERSNNGRDFEVVAVLKQSAGTLWKEWVDDSPARGKSAYRVRYLHPAGGERYSRLALIQVAGDISFKFYPNPVDNLLIVRSEAPVDLQIIDGNGKVRIAVNRLQRLQTLNVAGLEKGLYMVRVFNKTTGILIQERLLKN
ncbi:MAG: T9SS type A sorting domain-containing protein [Candidatus Pseudobacter hemicellulosilyticus]|uniref:T9SS type A sorting domain-containing protein n=1 Tax=Candidatus Pseudobacter hemicellulosilyticus TaxID=3121375 RepID=A0AAJ6BH55_9BACT|nr:MAG: T9SS type A sorting domain-containing protein [Pseudobacter sp.]